MVETTCPVNIPRYPLGIRDSLRTLVSYHQPGDEPLLSRSRFQLSRVTILIQLVLRRIIRTIPDEVIIRSVVGTDHIVVFIKRYDTFLLQPWLLAGCTVQERRRICKYTFPEGVASGNGRPLDDEAAETAWCASSAMPLASRTFRCTRPDGTACSGLRRAALRLDRPGLTISSCWVVGPGELAYV